MIVEILYFLIIAFVMNMLIGGFIVVCRREELTRKDFPWEFLRYLFLWWSIRYHEGSPPADENDPG